MQDKASYFIYLFILYQKLFGDNQTQYLNITGHKQKSMMVEMVCPCFTASEPR